jgi:hypothetical protein
MTDEPNLVAQFKEACLDGLQADETNDNVTACEPHFVRALEIAQQLPRPTAVGLFLDVFWDRIRASPHLVPFCMHELRFPELQQEATRVASQVDTYPRMLGHAAAVVSAYDDDWGDLILWSYHQ